jgi:hypothetical protein
MMENLWMLAMMGMFGLFLWSLQVEARRSLKAIARDEDDLTWRAEMQHVMAQRSARQRLSKMRDEEAKREKARRIKAEREAFRASHTRRSRWDYESPKQDNVDFDISGEAFGDHGFAHIAEVIDEDEFYTPLRSFNERVGRLGQRDRTPGNEVEATNSSSRLPELQKV